MNRLTSCRAFLLNYLTNQSPVPVKIVGDTTLHPARLYAEIRITGPVTRPTIENRFTVIVLIISIPAAADNMYQYIDIANQFHDLLQNLSLSVPDVGCLTQDGRLKVEDFGFVDKAETIKQATVTCDITLET